MHTFIPSSYDVGLKLDPSLVGDSRKIYGIFTPARLTGMTNCRSMFGDRVAVTVSPWEALPSYRR